MKTSILSFILVFFINLAWSDESLRALVRVEKDQQQFQIINQETGRPLPVIFTNKDLEKKLNDANHNDEMVIKGHIIYRPVATLEAQKMTPFLVIEEVYPVSLEAIGLKEYQGPDAVVKNLDFQYGPFRIPVTTEVASAMTITSTFLLLNSLSSNSDLEPAGRNELRQALFISAGTMATLVFLYDQLTGKTKP
jgi:hypothetical protein